MKKKILPLTMIVSLLLCLPSHAFALAGSPVASDSMSSYNSGENTDRKITITLNGEPVKPETNPIISGGILFISAKDFSESLELSMAWSENRKEITLTDGNTTVILKIGSNTALVNNKALVLPANLFAINGSAMLPVKYVGNLFGYQTSWDSSIHQAALTPPLDIASSTDSALRLLSYEEAMKTGIQKSPDYQSSLLAKDRAKTKNDDLFISITTYNPQLMQAKLDLRMYNNWADKQIIVTMEQIGNSVVNQMNDLSLLFVEKKNQQDKIDLMAEKLRIEKINYDYGMTSLQSFMAVQNNYHSEMQNLTILDQKINVAYTKFNQTLGNPADYRNILEYVITYAPIEEVDLDRKILYDTYEDPYIWFAEQNVDSKEFKLTTYEYNMGGQSWTLTALDLTEARKNLKDTKINLAGVIRDRYNNLIQLEEQIRLLELTLEQARDSVNSIRLQYDLGNAIKLQVEEAQMVIPGLEYQIQSLKQQHSQLKILFEKPYLAPTYVKAG